LLPHDNFASLSQPAFRGIRDTLGAAIEGKIGQTMKPARRSRATLKLRCSIALLAGTALLLGACANTSAPASSSVPALSKERIAEIPGSA
jgi:hypothetical protein